MNKVVLEQKGEELQMTFPAGTSRRMNCALGRRSSWSSSRTA